MNGSTHDTDSLDYLRQLIQLCRQEGVLIARGRAWEVQLGPKPAAEPVKKEPETVESHTVGIVDISADGSQVIADPDLFGLG